MDTITLASTRTRARPGDDYGLTFHAHLDEHAMHVSIDGEVDAFNVDRVSNYVGRVLAAGEPIVLDLRAVTFMSVSGLRALLTFDEECARVGVPWTMINSHAIDLMLTVAGGDLGLPVARSMDDALLRLAASGDDRPVPAVTPREVTRC